MQWHTFARILDKLKLFIWIMASQIDIFYGASPKMRWNLIFFLTIIRELAGFFFFSSVLKELIFTFPRNFQETQRKKRATSVHIFIQKKDTQNRVFLVIEWPNFDFVSKRVKNWEFFQKFCFFVLPVWFSIFCFVFFFFRLLKVDFFFCIYC